MSRSLSLLIEDIDSKIELIDTGFKNHNDGAVLFAKNADKDTYLHFTTKKTLESILKDGGLKGGEFASVYVVSTTYGIFKPDVQTTHIKFEDGDSLIAIKFTTKEVPFIGHVEETVFGKWDKDRGWPAGLIPFTGYEVITVEKAASLLSNEYYEKYGDFDVYFDEELLKKDYKQQR